MTQPVDKKNKFTRLNALLNFIPKPLLAGILLLVVLIGLNGVVHLLPLKLDITAHGLYTLSDGSKTILSEIPDEVVIKFYYSASAENIPPNMALYARKVRELLERYQNESNDKIRLEVYDPKPDTDTESWANRYGISAARLPNGGSAYFGMVSVADEKEAVIPFFDPQRERLLEYDISESISRVKQAKKRQIGILSSLPVSPGRMRFNQTQSAEWAAISELRKGYQVTMLSQQNLLPISAELELVIVIHPKINEVTAYALDQYLVRGGKLMVLLDPFARSDNSSIGRSAQSPSSNLKPLLSSWGIQYDSTKILADPQLATMVNTPNNGVLRYPVWLTFTPAHINRQSLITSQLEEILLIEPGYFSIKKGAPYTFIPLLTSSNQTGSIDFGSLRVLKPLDLVKSVQPNSKDIQNLAGILQGKFESAYPNGAPQAVLGAIAKSPPKKRIEHINRADKQSMVFIASDVDFMSNAFSVRQGGFLGSSVYRPVNDNLGLFLNTVEFLSGNPALINIRSRGQFSRPFTRVASIQAAAIEQYKSQEALLSTKLNEVSQRLQTLQKEAEQQGANKTLYTQQITELKKFRLEEQRIKQALREVRKLLREDIETLGSVLLFSNLLVMPLAVAIFGWWIISLRIRKSRQRQTQ